MGIDTCHQSLTGSLFIACGTIDLTGKEQVLDAFRLERMRQLRWWKVVVFDGISRSEYLSFFHAGNVT